MKTIRFALATLIVSLTGATSDLRAQTTPPPPPPPPPPPIAPPPPTPEVTEAFPSGPAQTVPPGNNFTPTKRKAPGAVLKIESGGIATVGAAPGQPALDLAQAAVDSVRTEYVVKTKSGPGRGSGRSLAIQSTEADPVAAANIEEDLTVMARIIEKSLRSLRDDDKHNVLGINVDGSVFGSSSGARNIYLEGYGALFLMSVRCPLLPPPAKSEEAKPKDATSTEWERARQEAFGSAEPLAAELDRAYSMTARTADPYDAEKVQALKDSLVESLKNATHIRVLKPGDYITIVVQGAETLAPDDKAGETVRFNKSSPGGAKNYATTVRRAPRGESILTLRVKKSDADAYAKGELDSAAFRTKVAMKTYLRRADFGGVAMFNLSLPQAR